MYLSINVPQSVSSPCFNRPTQPGCGLTRSCGVVYVVSPSAGAYRHQLGKAISVSRYVYTYTLDTYHCRCGGDMFCSAPLPAVSSATVCGSSTEIHGCAWRMCAVAAERVRRCVGGRVLVLVLVPEA